MRILTAGRPVFYAILATALAGSWQALTVKYNYGGNWTALFCTGADFKPPPPALASENIYLFPHSFGYDGQLYHYIAHDPFLRRGFSASLDTPRIRYNRIFVPLCAWLLAVGQDRFVDVAYYVVILLFVFLGSLWTARIIVDSGAHTVWSLLFLCVPAVALSLDRLTVDIGSVAFAAGIAWYIRRQLWVIVFVLCALACGTREAGFLFATGLAVWCVFNRRLGLAAMMACSMAPAYLWSLYVAARTQVPSIELFSPVLFAGILRRFATPVPYAFGAATNWAATILDYAALLGIVMAVVYCAVHFRELWKRPEGWMAFAFVGLVGVVSTAALWTEANSFARVYSPLLLLVGLDWFRTRSWIALLPMALVEPRIGLQIGSQVLGVVKGLLQV